LEEMFNKEKKLNDKKRIPHGNNGTTVISKPRKLPLLI